MSWGSCYATSNNIHFEYPAVMNDSRIYTSYDSSYYVNENIKELLKIKSNKDYKDYLVHNGESIIKHNKLAALNYNNSIYIKSKNVTSGGPYIFKQNYKKNMPFGYSDSTLKNQYLSRHELQSKQISPLINK